MHIRVATFNVENMFNRPKAMNFSKWSEGQPILNDYSKLNNLFNKETYTDKDKMNILKLLDKYGLLTRRPKNPYLELIKVRGRLIKRPKDKPPEIVANGRNDWVGWIDLKKETINDQAIKNTARVIAEVNPDILVLVEVENRLVLQQFYDQVLAPMLESYGLQKYGYNMVIDGNDRRGIDVGILSRAPIVNMRSHIADSNNNSLIFSRDCPEYFITLNGDSELVVLANHFSSKGSDYQGDRRRVQSQQVKDIYEQLREKYDHVIVAGDLNDHPEGGSLDPLLKKTDLKDAMSLPLYEGYPGTYSHANKKEKLDYLLFSPQLTSGVTAVNVERRGFYAPTKWPSFENINKKTKQRNQASDHHCLWADIEI